MKEDDLKSALIGTVSGDLESFQLLEETPHAETISISTKVPNLLLRKSALHMVLERLKDGSASPNQVQRWASFMKRGYIEGSSGPVLPIQIDFDAPFEVLIVETLSRLDELEDRVDGQISEDEISEMLRQLLG